VPPTTANLDIVCYLLEHSADPTIEDCSFPRDAHRLGRAEHNHQPHVVEYLSGLTP
jgi:hypothetical protein